MYLQLKICVLFLASCLDLRRVEGHDAVRPEHGLDLPTELASEEAGPGGPLGRAVEVVLEHLVNDVSFLELLNYLFLLLLFSVVLTAPDILLRAVGDTLIWLFVLVVAKNYTYIVILIRTLNA